MAGIEHQQKQQNRYARKPYKGNPAPGRRLPNPSVLSYAKIRS